VNWLYTRIRIDGEVLDLARVDFEQFSRTLDMKKGVYCREFIWNAKSGRKIKLKFSRFTSLDMAQLACQEIHFEALNFFGEIEVDSGMDFGTIHESIGNRNYWENCMALEHGDWTSIMAATERSNIHVFSTFRLECDSADTVAIIKEDKKVYRKLKIRFEESREISLHKLVINYTDKKTNGNASETEARGREMAESLSVISPDIAKKNHVKCWQKVWEKNDIVIEGDPENQQGIRYCIFQLYQTNHGQDASNNIGAKGLTGEIYSGHTFWDTEAYCLPFYLFNNPSAAKNLLLYRYKTLQEAKDWSIEQNCKGACYPMETIDGRESCPVWWHGNLEIHVPGAVGYGIWHYYNITADDGFLYKEGIEMLIEISRFYASRGDWREDGFGFYGVMGPDEFHTFINNNYYTNLLAKKIFLFTLEVLGNITEKRGYFPCDSEKEEWLRMAENMILPKDEGSGIFEQHEGYFKLPHIDIHSIPVEDFPLYHSWTLPRIYRYDMIKQPDVLLALFFFSHDYSMAEKIANYEFYEPRCIHESSLSPSVHSILASETGKKEEAYHFFEFATRLDLDNYNRNTREGLHITSIAAAWLNIVYGFGGMRSDGDLLSFAPTIPEKWKKYAFSICYKSLSLLVEVFPSRVIFTPVKNEREIEISVY
ncbi:MAG: family 65 glycosyl hydrolase, partial [Bacteroidales bacterium]|nr:family 65 glycosyl hydrolase [Bacteroidales bacterium]